MELSYLPILSANTRRRHQNPAKSSVNMPRQAWILPNLRRLLISATKQSVRAAILSSAILVDNTIAERAVAQLASKSMLL